MNSKGFSASPVHGNHRASQQQDAASRFNLCALNIIITTDMILRTLELENIKLVLSHDLPEDAQDYHNRLALMKELGIGIALVSPEDEPLLDNIEYNMKKEIEEKVVEGFVASKAPNHTAKDRTQKPRHRKRKPRKEQASNSTDT